MSFRARRWTASSLALITAVAAGCSEGPTTPAALAPSFNPTPPSPAARVRVCKDASSPTGTYDFTVSQVGGRGGTLLVGAAFSLGSGQCADVWEALPNPPNPDTPVVNVTVMELTPPAGIQVDSLVGASNADGPFFTTGPSWTVRVNYNHAAFYNYFNSTIPQGGGEGCTPGYWKQEQHFDSWTAPYTPGTQFSAVFEDAFPGETLLDVLELGGRGLNALGRMTVAALLNAASPDVDYDVATPAEVIAAFNAVFPGGDYETLKNTFDASNNAGCPID
jgi:hypothetical protein